MSNPLSLLFTTDFYSLPQSVQKEVYREYFKLVYPLIYFIIKEHQTAEDVIQESFLRAIDKAPQLQDVGRLEPWLKTVARNVSINFLRKLKRNRNELDVESVFINRESDSSLIYSTFEEDVQAVLLKEAIQGYVNVMKPEYRQMIEMRWYSDLSYKEIAAALGTNENVVRQKLYRVRETVKQKLLEDWGI